MNRVATTVCGSVIAVSLFVSCAQIISAQTTVMAQPGRVEKEEDCPVLKPYGELDKFGKLYFPDAVYEEARTQTQYECRHIWYLSDEISVSGYIFKPKAMKGSRWPAILYNRGGTGHFSLIDDLVRVEFYLLAKEGYVVLGTEYRSTGDKGRRDEWGGADVDDVLNLVSVARGLVLELIAQGMSNREIAGKLFVSENTVKTHSSRVFDKLGARRRTQAVQLGKEFGLLP